MSRLGAEKGKTLQDGNLKPYLGIAVATTVGHAALISLPFEVGSIIDGLQLQPSVGGLLVAIELTTYALTSFLIAPIINRISIRRTAQLGILVVVCASIWSAVTVDILQFCFARALAGFGFGIVFACPNAAGAYTHSPERAYGVGMGVATVFYMVLPSFFARSSEISSYLFPNLHPHSGIFLAVTLFVVVMLPTMHLLPGKCLRSPTLVTNAPDITRERSTLLSLLCLLVMALFSIGVFSLYAFTERLGNAVGMSPAEIGGWTSVSFGIGNAGIFVAVLMGRRFGVIRPLAIGLTIQGIACLALGLGQTEANLWYSYAVFCTAWSFLYPFLFGIAAGVDPSGRLPTAAGGVYLASSAIAASVGGFIIQYGGYAAIAIVSLILCLLAAALCAPLRVLLAQRAVPSIGGGNCAPIGAQH